MSYAQVIECIEILRGCRVIINPLNNHAKIDTSPLSSLVVVGKEDYLKDTSSRWRVDFSMAVTQSINDMSYRQHDYTIVMSLNDLARYLTLRMSHNWTQAAMKDFYPLKYTTIQRDSCLIESNRSDDNRKKLNSAFEEMIAKNRLLNVTEHDEIRGKRNKLIDITYHLHPHPDFVKEQKCANHRHK